MAGKKPKDGAPKSESRSAFKKRRKSGILQYHQEMWARALAWDDLPLEVRLDDSQGGILGASSLTFEWLDEGENLDRMTSLWVGEALYRGQDRYWGPCMSSRNFYALTLALQGWADSKCVYVPRLGEFFVLTSPGLLATDQDDGLAELTPEVRQAMELAFVEIDRLRAWGGLPFHDTSKIKWPRDTNQRLFLTALQERVGNDESIADIVREFSVEKKASEDSLFQVAHRYRSLWQQTGDMTL
jgi:hypothetical protein